MLNEGLSDRSSKKLSITASRPNILQAIVTDQIRPDIFV